MNIFNLMRSLIVLYWLDLLIVVVLITALFFYGKKGKVIEALYDRLPIVITLLFTRKEVEEFIDKAAIDLKEFLKSKENNLEST